MKLRITAGIRIGWWDPPFKCVGFYIGPDLGSHIPGTLITQELEEGALTCTVGVLLRSDLNFGQCQETILIIENHIEEMFDYTDWEAVG